MRGRIEDVNYKSPEEQLAELFVVPPPDYKRTVANGIKAYGDARAAEARTKALNEAAEEANSHIISNPEDNGWDHGYNKAVKGITRHIRRFADSPAKEDEG